MSLENIIHRRMELMSRGRLGRKAWAKEAEDLQTLVKAYEELTNPREQDEDESVEDAAEHEKAARKAFAGALRIVQSKYVFASNVFPIGQGTAGPFLCRNAPQALIMDEGSQMSETRTVLVIPRALRNGLRSSFNIP
ncbi:hypothetical protein LTR86_005910 [Recurvomyces mirabilis]|nr:hypothetical protein LTR86_005910 [Recurvomyces mirabilis]